MAIYNMDAKSVEPRPSMTPVPAGWYPATIISSTLETSKKEDAGEMFVLRFKIDEVAGAPAAGREIALYLCVNHSKIETQQFARADLASIALACDVPVLKDTSDLLGRSLKIRVKVTPAKGGYSEGNGLHGFQSLNDAAPIRVPLTTPKEEAPTTFPPKPPAPAPGQKPSWKK